MIGGFSFYRTFALYEEKKEFNVLKGRVPDYVKINTIAIINGEEGKIPTKEQECLIESITCDKENVGRWDEETWQVKVDNPTDKEITCTVQFNDEFARLKQLINSTATNMEELLSTTTDTNNLIANKEAMELLGNSDNLKKKMKASSSYNLSLAQKMANTNILTSSEKYALGLPYKVYNGGSHGFSQSDISSAWHITSFDNHGYSKVYVTSFSRSASSFGLAVSPNIVSSNNGRMHLSGSLTVDVFNYSKIYIDVAWGACVASTVNVGAIYAY